MKRVKKNKFLLRRIAVIVILIILIVVLRKLIFNNKLKNSQKELRLLYNNEFIELTNDLRIEDDIIYMSKEDIEKIFDSTIYYNIGDKELITTYNKHVAVLHLNENIAIINDSNSKMQGTLKQVDDIIYLPLTDLEIVYDIELEYSESTNMVIMDSTMKAKSRALVIRNAPVKEKKSIFSMSYQKAKIGEYVYIIEDLGKYKKVRTETGNIGYIKSRKIADIEVLREDWKEDELSENDFVDAFVINEEKTGISSVSQSFMTYTDRNNIINALYNEVIGGQYYRVIIDFANIDDINSFYRFVIELTPKFNESGVKVAVKNNKQIDTNKLENVVDFIIN